MKSPILLILIGACIASGAEKKPDFFICTDKTVQKTGPQPLVYTYINGKKTECMPRNELLAYYNRVVHGDGRSDSPEARELARIDSSKAANRNTKSYAGQNLSTQDLKGMKLAGVDFTGANLESCDLRNADLRNANFTRANLSSAYLKGADLRGADFANANVSGAYLNEADMRGVQNFSMDAVRVCRTLHQAALDTTFREEIEFCCSDKLRTAGWYWHDNQWADERGKKRRKKAKFESSARAQLD